MLVFLLVLLVSALVFGAFVLIGRVIASGSDLDSDDVQRRYSPPRRRPR